MKAKILIIICTYLTTINFTSATGLSVSPTRLDFEAADGGQAEQTLAVMNPTADVMVFEVYPDEFENVISANPESFTLESGGRKEVLIAVDAGLPGEALLARRSFSGGGAKSGGIISTNLSVVGKPLAESKVNPVRESATNLKLDWLQDHILPSPKTPLTFSNGVNVGAGAKIPVTINMALAKNSPANKTLLIVVLAAAVLSAAFYLGRRTKQTPEIKS